MTCTSFPVVVTREANVWLADVPALDGAHTWAKSLPSLERSVREAVVLAADLPDEMIPEIELDFEYHTGDDEVDATAAELRELRGKLVDRTATLASQLSAQGLSTRDIAALLGISFQRVSQILRRG